MKEGSAYWKTGKDGAHLVGFAEGAPVLRSGKSSASEGAGVPPFWVT